MTSEVVFYRVFPSLHAVKANLHTDVKNLIYVSENIASPFAGEGDDLADPNSESLVKHLQHLNELQKQGHLHVLNYW